MDRLSLFKIILSLTLCCLVLVGFAHTRNIFARTNLMMGSEALVNKVKAVVKLKEPQVQ